MLVEYVRLCTKCHSIYESGEKEQNEINRTTLLSWCSSCKKDTIHLESLDKLWLEKGEKYG